MSRTTAPARPDTTPDSTTTFADLGVPAEFTRKLDRLGITSPFPIQELTVEDSLAGRDLSGKAPTGSGKTLAFAIPVAARVGRALPAARAPCCWSRPVSWPRRSRRRSQPLAELRGRRVATIFGGTDIRKDVKRLRAGVDIVVACPGRLADLVRRGDISLADVELVVLDEADRMADMGFLPEVKRLLDAAARTARRCCSPPPSTATSTSWCVATSATRSAARSPHRSRSAATSVTCSGRPSVRCVAR